jgi:hypothetical protein
MFFFVFFLTAYPNHGDVHLFQIRRRRLHLFAAPPWAATTCTPSPPAAPLPPAAGC